MITATTANQISQNNVRLREAILKIEDEILASAKKGVFIATVGFVDDDMLFSVKKELTKHGYEVTQSKVRNNDGYYNLAICW